MIISGELVKGNTLSISKEEGNDELVWTVS
jgi:hypothetical protein